MVAQSQPKPYTSSVVEPRPKHYFNTSVGTKMLMGVTGLLLVLYLILHIVGNLLVFFGPVTFNNWSYMLVSNPLVVPVEIGLAAVFLIHIYKAVTNFWSNSRARPVKYYTKPWSQRLSGVGWPSRKNISSSTMIVSGIIIFIFIILHLAQFKFGPEYEVMAANGLPQRDLYRLEMEVFGNLLNVIFYVFVMIIVGFHLFHGFWSGFQSLGANHPKYTPVVRRIGQVFAFLMAAGFLSIPIWAYAFGWRLHA